MTRRLPGTRLFAATAACLTLLAGGSGVCGPHAGPGVTDTEIRTRRPVPSTTGLIEFDHHASVFLTNAEPAKFHVHTIVRTPNGNDYGIDLLRLHYANAAHHRHA